ncbi:MAG: carbamoyltransferase HypF [Gammaproteobacteria bacterium]|nr:carbamoyltransferase HypF [Gammaproteobacteria bacterium]
MLVARREGREVRVRGLVQGVGFRPAVWRLARECGLTGEVANDTQGVLIRVWGDAMGLDKFIRRLQSEAPPLARIDTIESVVIADGAPAAHFRIVASQAGEVHTGVVPDAATCPHCAAEVFDPASRHYRYPFTNCTHCGPRLSIVRAIPYDRANTSMARFVMCAECQREYDDPADRRFHAQPNACPACGPRVRLKHADSNVTVPLADSINAAGALILAGAIVAIKGIGGFHLACDACNSDAVARLRERKRRYHKPFALMVRDVDVIRRYCAVTHDDSVALTSSAAPIVVLPANGPEHLAAAVAPGQRSLGFMLPYTPLHHLLLARIARPVVLTSGNLSNEPQSIDNEAAREKLGAIADYLLTHDREIVNRLDDSVVRIMDGEMRILRRARGYAPAPIQLPLGFEQAPEILALGGELKNTFCLVKDGQAVLSQHMGDLEDAATSADYRKNIELYRALYEHDSPVLVVDRHPEYFSTKLGREWAEREDVTLIEVQHHHAHVASCMAEHQIALNTAPVLGVALDGLGYGDTGELWGGEFLLSDYAGFERLATFAPVAMLGGTRAIHEPWRNTYAHLVASIGWADYLRDYPDLELTHFLQTRPLAILDSMLVNNINSPAASSCGRLFDAVAAAIGVSREQAGHEGQAAIEMEALVDQHALEKASDAYPFNITCSFPPRRERLEPTPDLIRGWEGTTGEPLPAPQAPLSTLDCAPMWRALLHDLAHGTLRSIMAARFHLGLARAIVEMVRALRNEARFDTVALTGGVFQNKTLLEQVAGPLRAAGFKVLSHRKVPANDGGLSLGQAAIACARVLKADKSARRTGRLVSSESRIEEQASV